MNQSKLIATHDGTGFRSLPRHLFVVLLLASCAQAQTLSGTFSHVADSDGTRPTKGKSVTLTFNPGGACHVVAADASGAEKTVTGDGTYSTRAGRITISLPVLELSVANQPYTLQADNLTLPFLLFNEGAGTSQWVRVGSGMVPGPGAGDQQPPTPP